jgi:hypothetical protein
LSAAASVRRAKSAFARSLVTRELAGVSLAGGGPALVEKYKTRGLLHCWANEDGSQKIESKGPLGKKRMETIDDEVTAATLDYLEKAKKADKPFFLWWNSTRMHINTHLKPESRGKARHAQQRSLFPRGHAAHATGRGWRARREGAVAQRYESRQENRQGTPGRL